MNKPKNISYLSSHIEKMLHGMDEHIENLGLNMSHIYSKELEKARKLAEIDTIRPAREFAEAVQTIINLESVFDTKLNQNIVNNFVEQQREFSKRFSSIIENNASLMGAANIASIQSSFAALEQVQNIPFEELEKIYEEEFDEIKEEELGEPESVEFFIKLFLYFREKATELPNGQISALGLTKLAVSCLILYVGLKSGTEAEKDREELIRIQKNTNKKIETFTNKLSPCLEELAKSDGEEFIVSTKRECPIRSTPTAEADTLTHAFTGQEVEVVDSLSRWYQVKYFHAADTTIRAGFIYKGHVQQ